MGIRVDRPQSKEQRSEPGVLKPVIADNKVAVMPPASTVPVTASELRDFSKSIFETVNRVARSTGDWVGSESGWLNGERLEVHPFLPSKGTLNAWCDHDRNDLDADGNTAEPVLRFDVDVTRRQDNGTLFASCDPQTVAHEAGHAVFWGMLGTRPDDKERFGSLKLRERSEFIAIDEALADVTALLSELARPEVVQEMRQETGGDLTRSNIASRQTATILRHLETKVGDRFSLSDATVRGRFERLVALENLQVMVQNGDARFRTALAGAAGKRGLGSLVESLEFALGPSLEQYLEAVEQREGLEEWELGNPLSAGLAKLSFTSHDDYNRLIALGDTLRELVDEVALQLASVAPEQVRDRHQQTVSAAIARRREESWGLGRDLATLFEVPEGITEPHVLSVALSGAVYEVLAAEVTQKTQEGINFEAAIADARETLGKVVFRAAASFAAKAGATAFSFTHFAQELLVEAQAITPESTSQWIDALMRRGIKVEVADGGAAPLTTTVGTMKEIT